MRWTWIKARLRLILELLEGWPTTLVQSLKQLCLICLDLAAFSPVVVSIISSDCSPAKTFLLSARLLVLTDCSPPWKRWIYCQVPATLARFWSQFFQKMPLIRLGLLKHC